MACAGLAGAAFVQEQRTSRSYNFVSNSRPIAARGRGDTRRIEEEWEPNGREGDREAEEDREET